MICVMKKIFTFWTSESNRPIAEPDTHIPVVINDNLFDGSLDYIASAPPDYRMSFSGSALPFVSYEQAMQYTPNTGTLSVKRGEQLMIPLDYPNSFYMGSHLVHPTVFIRYKTTSDKVVHAAVKIGESVPFRTLYPNTMWYDGVSFYEKKYDGHVTTQEKVLQNSAYPSTNITPDDFWGKKPPN